MKKPRFTYVQIALALVQVEQDVSEKETLAYHSFPFPSVMKVN